MPSDSPRHLTPSQLQAFRDARLAEAEARDLDSHLAVCGACQAALESLAEDDLVRRCRKAGLADSNSTHQPADTGAPAPAGPPMTVPADLANHPRYQILEFLGAGGMGAVFKAQHRLLKNHVAIKVVGSQLIANPRAVKRFHQEGENVARLKHPNIVTVHDADQAGTTHFLVMELVEGIPLDRQVEEHGPLPIHQACIDARQAAMGLQHAFEKGLVHRDIKPRNLMLTPDGWVKILDFGLARFVSESRSVEGLTQQGDVMGTPDYLAPEQAENAHAADIRADIYSLGCTLYFLLGGQPPFPGGSVVEKLNAHLSAAPRPSLRSGPRCRRSCGASSSACWPRSRRIATRRRPRPPRLSSPFCAPSPHPHRSHNGRASAGGCRGPRPPPCFFLCWASRSFISAPTRGWWKSRRTMTRSR